MNTASGFAHRRLDAFRVALELFQGVERLTAGFPRGHADLKDQLRRAAGATVRNLVEGANRAHPRDKAARFIIARGECAECDAALEMAQIVGIVPRARVVQLRSQGERVGAMLTGLIRRQQAEVGRRP